jgi:glutathione S-transferase
MLNLHYAKGTVSIAVAIALEETGLAYTPVKVDFATADQTKPAFLKLNPKGRVPVLVTEQGQALMPTNPEDAAHLRGVMYYLASTMHVAHAHKMRGSRWADQDSSIEDMKKKTPETMAACAAYVQSDCLRGDFVMGDSFSIADPYLFIVCNWLAGDGVPLADFPRIDAFMARMEARDSVKAIRAKGML